MNRTIEVWSVYKILRMIFLGELDYKANVQRQFIYNSKQQQQVIKSIEKGFLASSLVIEQTTPNNYVLLDGKQRINSIIGFINRAFNVENFYFSDEFRNDFPNPHDRYISPDILEPGLVEGNLDSKKLLNYSFPIILYRNLTEDERLTLFNVINTTGVSLNNWELINGRFPSGVLLDMRANYFNEKVSTNSTSLDPNFINVKRFSKYFGTTLVNRGELYIKIIEKLYKMKNDDFNDNSYEIIDGIVINTKNYHRLSKFIESNNDTEFQIFAKDLINKLEIFYDLFADLSNLGVLKESCFNIIDLDIYKQKNQEFFKKRDILAYLISQYNNSDLKIDNNHDRYFENVILPQVLLIESDFRNTLDTKRFYNSDDKERLFFAANTFDSETNQVQCRGHMDDAETEIGCGKWITKKEATVDHILPWIMGGRTNDENAQILCRECNSSKGSRITKILLKKVRN